MTTGKRVRLMLVPHTETTYNQRGLWTGQHDVDLTKAGQAAVEPLAQQIAAVPGIVAVYGSDLQRAVVLARRIQQLTVVPLVIHPKLREIHMGEKAGMSKDPQAIPVSQLLEGDARYDHRQNPHFDFSDILGETADDFLRRYGPAIQGIANQYGATEVADDDLPVVVLVGHSGAFRRFFIQEHKLIDQLPSQGDCVIVNWPPPALAAAV